MKFPDCPEGVNRFVWILRASQEVRAARQTPQRRPTFDSAAALEWDRRVAHEEYLRKRGVKVTATSPSQAKVA